MLHHSTKRRITTSSKTKNNKNCQKIELYGSPTTKELKKYSSRVVERQKWEADMVRTWDKVAGRPGLPHLSVDKLGGKLVRQTEQPRLPMWEIKA